MRTIKTAYERFGAIALCLGRAGENGVTEIRIDISTPMEEYPGAWFGIAVESPDGTCYPAVSETDGDALVWTVSSADTAKSGKGRAQVVMYGESGEIGRSKPVDTIVMTSIVADSEPPDPVKNWLDNAEKVLGSAGGAYAPAIEVTTEGNAIADAAGGHAFAAVAILKPKTADGSFAPAYDGGLFAEHGTIGLTVNGTAYSRTLPPGVYAGTYDWVTGQLVSNAYKLSAAGYTVLTSGTNSSGLNYVQIETPDLTAMLACNRYTRNDEAPYADKSIRVRSNSIYIYDSSIDLDNPSAILDGLEFMLPLDAPATYELEPQAIALVKGANIVSADTGDTSVTYGIDTKTYIDNKFAELSTALLGG